MSTTADFSIPIDGFDGRAKLIAAGLPVDYVAPRQTGIHVASIPHNAIVCVEGTRRGLYLGALTARRKVRGWRTVKATAGLPVILSALVDGLWRPVYGNL